MDKGFACPSVVPVSKQSEDKSFQASPCWFGSAFPWCLLSSVTGVLQRGKDFRSHRLPAAQLGLAPISRRKKTSCEAGLSIEILKNRVFNRRMFDGGEPLPARMPTCNPWVEMTRLSPAR